MNPKKSILIIKCSPRRPSSSSMLADQLADAARQAGAQVEIIDIGRMNIQPCQACDGCRTGVDGGCITDDDMLDIYPKIDAAGALVLASPIYFFNLSAQAKLFLDRFYAYGAQRYRPLIGKDMALLLTYGDDDPFSSGAVNAIRTFQDICHYIKSNLVGMVYGTGWDGLEAPQQADLFEKARKLGEKLAAE